MVSGDSAVCTIGTSDQLTKQRQLPSGIGVAPLRLNVAVHVRPPVFTLARPLCKNVHCQALELLDTGWPLEKGARQHPVD